MPAISWAEEICVQEAQSFPKDVSDFVESRCYCDHFRGEPGYDKERQDYINKMTMKYCTGSDRRLKELRNNYAKDVSIIAKLNGYEDKIEGE